MRKQRKLILIISLIAIIFLAYKFIVPSIFQNNNTVSVYFIKGDKLQSVFRELPKKSNPLYVAALELLKGPNNSESRDGFFSEIPKGTKILGAKSSGNILEVNFSKELEGYGGGTSRVKALVAEIVYTLTEASKADKVRILIEGKKEAVLGGEGYIIDRPLSKDDIMF